MGYMEKILKSGHKYPILNTMTIPNLMDIYDKAGKKGDTKIKWLFGYYDIEYWNQRGNIKGADNEFKNYPLIIQYIYKLYKNKQSLIEPDLNNYINTTGLFDGIDRLIGSRNTVYRALNQIDDNFLINNIQKMLSTNDPYIDKYNIIYYFKFIKKNNDIIEKFDMNEIWKKPQHKEYIEGSKGIYIPDSIYNLSGLIDHFKYDIIINNISSIIKYNFYISYITLSMIDVYMFHKEFIIMLCQKDIQCFEVTFEKATMYNDYQFVNRLLQIYQIDNIIINLINDIYNKYNSQYRSSYQMVSTIQKYVPSFSVNNIQIYLASLIYGDYETINKLRGCIDDNTAESLTDIQIPEMAKYYK